MQKLKTVAILFFFMAVCSVAHAETILIDLNEFYADTTVSVASDGSSATLEEDPSYAYVMLSNDPYYGDPGIAVPENLFSISFSFNFIEGAANDDRFYAKVFDGASGLIIDNFLTLSPGEGNITWNLSALDPAITILGMEFQLSANDTLADSTVLISNVMVTTLNAAVPEPSTLFLFGAGLIAYAGTIRFRKNL